MAELVLQSGTVFHDSILDEALLPDYAERMLKQYPEDYKDINLIYKMCGMGRVRKISNLVTTAWEKPRVKRIFYPGATYGAAADGAARTILFAASSHTTRGGIPVIVGDHLHFADAAQEYDIVTGRVTAVGGTSGARTVTVVPLNNTQNIPALTDAVTAILWESNSFGEGTFGPEGRQSDVIKYDWNTKLTKTAHKSTGHAMALATRVEMMASNGSMKNILMWNGWEDHVEEAARNQGWDFLFARGGVDFVNNALIGETQVEETMGLYKWLQGGHGEAAPKLTIPLGGPFFIADYDALVDLWKEFGGGTERIGVFEFGLRRLICDELRSTLATSGGITYGSYGALKDLAIKLGIESIYKDGYTLHMETIKELDDPQKVGNPAFPYKGTGFIMPGGKIADAKSSDMCYYAELLTLATSELDRTSKTWITGGHAPTPTDDGDYIKFTNQRQTGNVFRGLPQWTFVGP